jgi:hypothetical protein
LAAGEKRIHLTASSSHVTRVPTCGCAYPVSCEKCASDIASEFVSASHRATPNLYQCDKNDTAQNRNQCYFNALAE